MKASACGDLKPINIRYRGDDHRGRALLVQNERVIIGFQCKTARRAKRDGPVELPDAEEVKEAMT